MPFGIENYHATHKTLHVNCEKPRAYFVPFSNACDANDGVREYSEYFKTLTGEWDFKFYNNLFEAEDPAGAVEFFETLDVPMNWQHAFGRNYDKIQYTNSDYPIPLDPPNVPLENPVGLYSRSFTLTEEELASKKGRRESQRGTPRYTRGRHHRTRRRGGRGGRCRPDRCRRG